jgi:hypothetical protein
MATRRAITIPGLTIILMFSFPILKKVGNCEFSSSGLNIIASGMIREWNKAILVRQF